MSPKFCKTTDNLFWTDLQLKQHLFYPISTLLGFFILSNSLHLYHSKQKIKYNKMAVSVVTTDDLEVFRHNLLNDLRTIMQTKAPKQMQWLKSSEVRKTLKISPGTLQNLRINGTLSFTKIGSIIYYNQDDIDSLLTKNKSH